MKRNLFAYRLPGDFAPGRSFLVQALWHIINNTLLNSFLPGSRIRVMLLRMFGAKIGDHVVIKPYVRVKFPWKLKIDQGTWIGESVWIDNHTHVDIGDNVCISQGAYLCCGSHNWHDPYFKLIVGSISIESGAWICAFAKLGPNTRIGTNAVVSMGDVFSGDLPGYSRWKNNSAVSIEPI